MFKNILVPMDGSNLSELALANAVLIASGSESTKLNIIYVVEPFKSLAHWVSDDIAQKMEKEAVRVARKYLDQTVEKLSIKGITAEGVIVKGNPAEVIREYAVKTGVDLIVMGTHGRTGFSRLMFGSVASSVIHNSPMPVMLVPPNVPISDK
jgi:nucleotide-binding universal stress UspA family protein